MLIATLGVPLVGAVLGALAAESFTGKRLLSGLALLNLGAAALLAVLVTFGKPDFVPGPWNLALAADRLGVLFALLAAGIQATVLPYAARCLDPRAFRRFAAVSQVLVAATDLTGTAATLSTLVLGWVVASVAVYALVAGTGAPPGAARRLGAAFLLGDGALVGALVMIWRFAGDPSLSRLSEAEARLAAVRFVLGPAVLTAGDAVAVLVVASAVVRSALWPGPRWLPSTLAAPTPVSALLHAGVVNAGGFLLIRLSPFFAATPAASVLALTAGLGTAALGGVASAVRSDVKGALVYSTMSQMGFMIAECAVGAFAAAAFHLVAHGMYKASLFLGSGDGISEHVHDRRSCAPPAPAPNRMRPVLACTGAFGLLALAGLLHPALLAHRGGEVTVVFAAVTSGALLWGWAERRQAFGQTPWAFLGVAVAGAAYLLWFSAVTGWLTPELPAVGAGFLSPFWLLGALVAAGGLAAIVAYAGRWPRVAARLHARALWAAWGMPPTRSAMSAAKQRRRLEVELWKQPV